MKISNNNIGCVAFNELAVGEVFLYKGAVYMKTEFSIHGYENAVKLETGELILIEKDRATHEEPFVIVLKAELKINGVKTTK
jgi:hypothetical protein